MVRNIINNINGTNGKYLLFKKKPVDVLMYLQDNTRPKYVSYISKEINCTYAHTEKILDTFRELSMVSFKKDGRRKYIKLTNKGEKIGKLVENLLIICNDR
ncbi:MAG: hypothetical protein DRN66_02770 [Candidatus Nanohalarchaeota archaeon]|nr:MAG: hypothetical protein DRN66_02770 [Candidatus Nanohaloarchaeota archaeon]